MFKHDPGLFFTAFLRFPLHVPVFLRNREPREDVSENLPSLKISFTAAWEKQNAFDIQKRGKPANSDKAEHPKGSLFHTSRRFQRFPRPRPKTQSYIIRHFTSLLFTLMLEPISLFHKNQKLRQRRVKLVPLQVCAYYISVPFSQIMLLTFSLLSVFQVVVI